MFSIFNSKSKIVPVEIIPIYKNNEETFRVHKPSSLKCVEIYDENGRDINYTIKQINRRRKHFNLNNHISRD
jgi:hypothetical protein